MHRTMLVVGFLLAASAPCRGQGDRKSPVPLQTKVQRLEEQLLQTQRILRAVIHRVPEEDVRELNREMATLFQKKAEEYRLTKQVWDRRIELAEKSHAAKIARMRAAHTLGVRAKSPVARIDAALEELVELGLSMDGALGSGARKVADVQLEKEIAQTRDELRGSVQEKLAANSALVKRLAELEAAFAQAPKPRDPDAELLERQKRASQAVEEWIAIHQDKLRAALTRASVDRTKVDSTLRVLEHLVKGRAKLPLLASAKSIDAEIHRLRRVHLGLRAEKARARK